MRPGTRDLNWRSPGGVAGVERMNRTLQDELDKYRGSAAASNAYVPASWTLPCPGCDRPTRNVLADTLAKLEGGGGAIVTSPGMAAVNCGATISGSSAYLVQEDSRIARISS